MSEPMRLNPPPIGVRVLRSTDEAAQVPAYRGISYCDAVRRAGEGEVLRVLPGSIQVCQWVPAVLGLTRAANHFEEHLAPRLDYPVAGLLLAPLDRFPGEPSVVLVCATPATLRELIGRVGSHGLARAYPAQGKPSVATASRRILWDGHQNRLDWSVVPFFTGKRPTSHYRFVQAVNRILARLARSGRWRALTFRLFRSHFLTESYDTLISHTLADMSICRNSTVIPLRTGQVNISFFCSGGITWGLNDPEHLTSGWPWPVFQRLLLPGANDG